MPRWKFLFTEDLTDFEKEKSNLESNCKQIKHIYLDITYQCPGNCPYCYAKASKNFGRKLKTEEIQELMEYMRKRKIRLLTLNGGDPLFREDVFDLIKYGNSLGLNISLITSGPLAIDKMKMLEKAGIQRIQFSLEGADEKIHDLLKGWPGSFRKTVKAIKEARNTDIRVSICSTVHKKSVSQVMGIYRLTKKLGAHEYRIMRLISPIGAKFYYLTSHVTVVEYRNLLRELVLAYMNDFGIKIYAEEAYPYLLDFKRTDAWEILNDHGQCSQGKSVCAITADGSITACPMAVNDKTVAGSILKDDLADVWKRSKVFDYYRNTSPISFCRSCKFSEVCIGGCRCAAFGFYGHLSAPDPMCPLVDHKRFETQNLNGDIHKMPQDAAEH